MKGVEEEGRLQYHRARFSSRYCTLHSASKGPPSCSFLTFDESQQSLLYALYRFLWFKGCYDV